MRDLLTVAHLTLVEARRRRILVAGAICAIAFLVVYSVAVGFAYREMMADGKVSFLERQATLTAMLLVGFMAVNFLSVLFAILLPVDTLSGEIDSGVMQTIASKPIGRAQIVLGKWLGHLVLALTYFLVQSAGILIVVRITSGIFPAGIFYTLPLLMLAITISLSITVAAGSRFTTVTTGIAAIGFYGLSFIGGLVEQIGVFAGIKTLRTVGIVVSLITPADSMWRLASHYLQPEILRSTGMLTLGGPEPTGLMVWWAVGFVVATLTYAVRTFKRRAL